MVESSVLNQILDLLRLQSSKVHLLGGYYNNVYEITAEDPIVVKIYNNEMNHEQSILSEIEWVQFLHNNDVKTSIPIMINNASYINQLPGNQYFVAFKKVKGIHVETNDGQVWNSKLFSVWGMGMAKMHSLAKFFKGKYKRPDWTEQKIFKININHLDARIKEKWEKYCNDLRTMNKSQATFGIIHGDLHHQNFLISNGDLTFIDFGDSEHNWFAYDVAIAVYHAAQTVNDVIKRREFAKRFFSSFINGYSLNNPVNEILSQVDYFINYRHLYSYVYHSCFSDKGKLNEQQLKYLEDMRLLIDKDSYLGISLV